MTALPCVIKSSDRPLILATRYQTTPVGQPLAAMSRAASIVMKAGEIQLVRIPLGQSVAWLIERMRLIDYHGLAALEANLPATAR